MWSAILDVMPAPIRTPRNSWIAAGLRALAAGGPDTVRVESLAKAMGVTKGGFYWHFADRDELLAEMLDTWERRSTDEVIERVEREGGDAMTKAQRAGVLTFGDDLREIAFAVAVGSHFIAADYRTGSRADVMESVIRLLQA